MEDWVPSYLWNDPNFVNWWNSALDSERMAFVREQNKQSAIAPVSLPTQQQSEITARPNYQYTEYKDYSSEVDGDEELPQRSGGDWMANALTLMNGATSIINTTRDMSRIADTSRQRNMIQDLGNIGTSKYGNYQQAISDMSRLDSMQPNLSLDTIRGHSTKEQIGGVLSNMMTGATTGAQVGGPYGALFGGLAGGVAGAWGIVSNNLDAKAERNTDTAMLANALDRSNINIAAGIEDLQNDTHRNKIYNLGAKGGKIQRKRTPIKAEKVKGGTKIRIKR